MSEPEISRRCAACGVSVRKSAMFCPQCGNPIVTYQATDDVQTARTQALHTVPTADDESQPQHAQTAPTQTLHPSSNLPPTALHGVAENVRKRVEKIRHVSHVVID